jgi:hypothetical protein
LASFPPLVGTGATAGAAKEWRWCDQINAARVRDLLIQEISVDALRVAAARGRLEASREQMGPGAARGSG